VCPTQRLGWVTARSPGVANRLPKRLGRATANFACSKMTENCRWTHSSSRVFEHVLQQYAEVIKEREAALLREKTAREQFEASVRAAIDSVILPAAAQVKDLAARTNWVCLATKCDIEIYQGNMKATTGERPHVKFLAASKANDVQIYASQQNC
jgi:hypothetical protein